MSSGQNSNNVEEPAAISANQVASLKAMALLLLAYHSKLQKNPRTFNSLSGEIVASCSVFLVNVNPIEANAAGNEQAMNDFLSDLQTLFDDDLVDGLRNALYEGDSKEADQFMKKIQGYLENYNEAGKTQPARAPLIIDLGVSGIELKKLEDGVYFDLDNNSFAEKTAWIGTEDGFLALDRNGNGKIDNGGELFGDQVILKDGSKSTSGFKALVELDGNGNSIIDSNDSTFVNLRVWIDANHNGISESNELKTLNELGIASISCNYVEASIIDRETGTRIADSSNVTIIKNGTTTTAKISEFWFPINSSDTTQGGITTAGNVPNIFKAISEDESGELFEL